MSSGDGFASFERDGKCFVDPRLDDDAGTEIGLEKFGGVDEFAGLEEEVGGGNHHARVDAAFVEKIVPDLRRFKLIQILWGQPPWPLAGSCSIDQQFPQRGLWRN